MADEQLRFGKLTIIGDYPSYKKGYKTSEFVKINGIDRIDPSEGYTKTNSAACCWDCNRMKGSMSCYDFVKHLANILHNLGNTPHVTT